MKHTLPDTIAYFEVHVPYRSDQSRAQVRDLITRYLYANATLTNLMPPQDEDESWTGLIQCACRNEADVQYQRDRFASGLYGTTEPVVYKAVVAE